MNSIETTLGLLVQAEPVLCGVKDPSTGAVITPGLVALRLPAKHAYHLEKLARLLSEETRHFHAKREAAIHELGTKRDDGQVEIPQGSEAIREFVKRLNELAEIPVVIHWKPITLDMLGDEKVSAADLHALGPLLADVDEKESKE